MLIFTPTFIQTNSFHHLNIPPLPISPTPVEVQMSTLTPISTLKHVHVSPSHEDAFSFKTPQDEYELTSSDSDSSRTDPIRERLRPPSRIASHSPHLSAFHAGTPMRMAATDPWQLQQDSVWRVGTRASPPLQSNISQQASTNSVLDTLVSISTQVAELMSQVGTSGAVGAKGLYNDVGLPPGHKSAPSLTQPLLGALPLATRYYHAKLISSLLLPPP